MTHWPFWGVGLGLAAVALVHWALTRRMLAVSGRITSLVDRVRHGAEDTPEMSEEELRAALAAVTAAEFGESASSRQATAEPSVGASSESRERDAPGAGIVLVPRGDVPLTHGTFLVALLVGALIATVTSGSFAGVTPALHGPGFAARFGSGPGAWAVLALGGVLVGFGTRMAGGCTSGHGLCGVSRFQPGSLAATACFFAAGIAVAFLLGGVLS